MAYNQATRPTPEELETLAMLCSEAALARALSLRPDLCPNPSVQALNADITLSHQRNANALLAVLRHLGVRDIPPEPLSFT